MRIKIMLVCPDPNCNGAKILHPDSMNPHQKQSYRYVHICGSRRTDVMTKYRYIYGFFTSGFNASVKSLHVLYDFKIQIYFAQVRNKWLRILETSGGRSANITGANTAAQTASSADGRGSSGQSNHNNGFANVRGRGRGGFGRGGQRGGGSNRGGSRVIPRQPTPPATVLYC
jgi:hypothetical protein